MLKSRITPLLIALALAICGCSTAKARGASIKAVASPVGQTTASSLERSCALLNTRDLASIFPTHTETILPKPQIAQVDHPIFSASNAPGAETSCVYYSFYLPGSHSEVVLQVNYWLDLPASASAEPLWKQDWTSARAAGTNGLSGIADAAFYKNGRLSFQKDDVYVTVQAVETDWNSGSASDMQKQLAVEKQIATDILSHLQ